MIGVSTGLPVGFFAARLAEAGPDLCTLRRVLLVGAAMAAFSPVPAALAQEGASEDEFQGEIIVTATKREQSLLDVPVSVSVTSGETLERAQIRDLKDLQSVVPSLRVNQLQSSANTNFYIRGFGNGANNVGIEPSVGLFVDGVYRSRSASMIADFPDVERIEVLRGPQSTLFGKNASAGVISIVTQKPQFDFGGNIEVGYGNYDAMVVKGRVTGPITDTIAASIAGGVNKRDGMVRDLATGERTNDRDRWFLRGQLLFDDRDDLHIRLIGDYGRIDENCCAAVNLRQAQPTAAIFALGGAVNRPDQKFDNITYNNLLSSNRIENWGLSGQVDYDLGAVNLTSITAYRRTDAVTNQDSDFSSADLLERNWQDLRIRTFTQELRANFDLGERLHGLVGGYYFNEKIDQNNEVYWGQDARAYANLLVQGQTGGAFTIPMLETVFGARTGSFFQAGTGLTEAYSLRNEAWSLFGQLDFEVNPGLTVTAGINYTHDSKRFATDTTSSDVFAGIDLGAPGNPLGPLRALQFFPPFMNVPNAVEPGRVSDGDFSYTARIAYDLSPSVNVYASFATGYKAASVNLSRDSRPSAADLTALRAQGLAVTNLTAGSRYADPEDSTVYEAGLKGDWGPVTANFAVFRQVIRGFQSNIFTGSGFLLANAGKQSVLGIEFDGSARPIEPLLLTLSLTYLDGEYDSFERSGVGDITGTRTPGYSPLSATFGAQYTQEIGNGDRLILRGDYHYEAPFMLVEGLPGLTVKDAEGRIIDARAAIQAARDFKQDVNDVNASLTYAMASGVELSVWARNLLDNRTILQIFDSPAQPGSISGYPNQPRTYGVAARYRF